MGKVVIRATDHEKPATSSVRVQDLSEHVMRY